MTIVVAIVLSSMNTVLKPVHEQNEAIFNKKAILSAIESKLGEGVVADKLSDSEVAEIFNNQIQQSVVDFEGNPVSEEEVRARGYKGGLAEHIDMAKERKKPIEQRIFPVFLYQDSQGEKIYIISIRGNGLWDEIWGNIALEEDFNTIIGVSFDHKGETPGLGAEIKDNAAFKRQFTGKKLYDKLGRYVSVTVKKGGVRDPEHEVDAISGATVTGNGVTKMLFDGISYYQPFFDRQ